MKILRKPARILASILALVLALNAGAALAEFDMSVIRENKYLKIDVDKDSDVAYIESTFSAKDCSFTHDNDSPTRYSVTEFDILMINYFSSGTYPILRLWMYVSTESQFYYYNSVSFTVKDKTYTFSDVSNKDWFDQGDKYYEQQLLIKFGPKSLDFLLALFELAGEGFEAGSFDDIHIPVVFHGTKDINGTLDKGFLVEYYLLISAFIEAGGLDYLDKVMETSVNAV